jgi:hypothetical protein
MQFGEDYFNCGWYFNTGIVAMPLHGLTLGDFDKNRIAAYRLQIPDCVPFDKELAVKIEHGSVCDYSDADYSSTAYYYQKEPHSDFFRLPDPSKINLPRPATPPVPYALEAENLSPKASDGDLRMLKWEDITSDRCGTGTPTLTPQKAGASLTFKVPVINRDCYRIVGYMAKGKSYGKVSCSIDGHSPAEPVNLYAAGDTVPAQPVTLAEALLEPGVHDVALSVATENTDGKLPEISIDKFLMVSMSPWITDWKAIGPFEDRGLDHAYGPDTDGFVPDAVYDGMQGKVSWKSVRADRKGYVNIGDVLKPKEYSRGYAFTRVISPDDREVEMMIGCVDGMKVWINGKEVWKHDVWRPAEPDQDRFMVKLRKGENIILMKIRVGDKWGIYARFQDPAGEIRCSVER